MLDVNQQQICSLQKYKLENELFVKFSMIVVKNISF